MLDAGSRYANSPQATLTVDSVPRTVIVGSAQKNYTFGYDSYQICGGDTPDSIAVKFYGNPNMWWAVADGNPEILDWSTLPVGTLIRIPNQ
jgi:phage tail protein X